ncbi:MAG: hypothetical protein JNK82_24680 [Myxococcaceae bacterium]|nr:hypothetical protein [Myxococcaceae bacterium]
MSIKSVRAEIKTAMKQNAGIEKELTRAEARRIVTEAKKNGVTPGELKEVQKLVGNGVDPAGPMTKALPELRGDSFYMRPAAAKVLDTFVRANTPGGPNMHTMAVPENPTDTNPPVVTLAIPENPIDSGPPMMTLAIPENPGDSGPPMMTLAIPENPGDARS